MISCASSFLHLLCYHFPDIFFPFALVISYSSQAAAIWLANNFLISGEAVNATGDLEVVGEHIYELLGWRYARPLVPASPDDDSVQGTERTSRRTPNAIDRAVWPANFVHVEDERLNYNQGGNA